jgi:putative peptidoglycan lipid II flippase
LYLLVQLPPAVNSGFKYRFIFKPFDPLLVQSFLLILPRFFAVAATQAELTFAVFIASSLPVGSVTIFNFSSNIYLLPVSVIGLSFALASFPTFSKLYAQSNLAELSDKFSLTFRQVAFVVIPASFLMWTLRDSIIGFIYLHGNFSATAAALMSATLAILCFGIFFYSEIHVMYRMFFALKDTVTPTLITIVSVIACVLMTFFFIGLVATAPFQGLLKNLLNLNQIQDVRILGLALAFSLSIFLQFLLASFFLAQRNHRLIKAGEIGSSGAKSFLAGLVMAMVIYILREKIFTGFTSPFWNLAVYGIIGASVYVLLAFALRCQEIKTFKDIGANFLNRYQTTTK